jgi:glyoxylase-like metal-dependent hydrolase (beta-lactamase superfamily II)
MNLGSTIINIVSDGTFLVDGGAVFGQIPKSQWENYVKPDRRNRIRLGLNTLLIQTPKLNILVDSGAGSKRQDKLKDTYGLNGNKLMRGLKTLGLTARDIDVVLLSHLHFDHCGGCTKLDRSGGAVPTFPKAKYVVQRACWDEASEPNERYKSHFYQDDFQPLEERNMVEFLDGDAEIIPGVHVKVANGPSDGHQIVLIERGSEKLAYVSDLIPTPYHLPLAYIPATDAHPNETLVQKRELLDMATEGGWLVIFGHGHELRSGYIQQKNGTPQLLPVEL